MIDSGGTRSRHVRVTSRNRCICARYDHAAHAERFRRSRIREPSRVIAMIHARYVKLVPRRVAATGKKESRPDLRDTMQR